MESIIIFLFVMRKTSHNKRYANILFTFGVHTITSYTYAHTHINLAQYIQLWGSYPAMCVHIRTETDG